MTFKFGSGYLPSYIDIDDGLVPYSIFPSPFSKLENGFGLSSYQQMQEWLSLGPSVDVPQRFSSSYQTRILPNAMTSVINRNLIFVPISLGPAVWIGRSYGHTQAEFLLNNSFDNANLTDDSIAFSTIPLYDTFGNGCLMQESTALSYWSVRGFFDFQTTVDAFLEKWEEVVMKCVWAVRMKARLICRKMERDSSLVAREIERFFHARLVEPRTMLTLASA